MTSERTWLHRAACFLGVHRLRIDREVINGVQWAFCVDCGCRFEASYDMTYGHTVFKRR